LDFHVAVNTFRRIKPRHSDNESGVFLAPPSRALDRTALPQSSGNVINDLGDKRALPQSGTSSSRSRSPSQRAVFEEEANMGRGILLWLLGVPIPVIILLWLFFGH
jgi:hypothetical protein